MASLVSSSLGLDAFEGAPVELRPNASEDDLQAVIRGVYRQVLSNAHLMESERLSSAESMLRNGDITVRGFIRIVAQSELYQNRFFSNSSPYRFIELNCKNLLGRAPIDQEEISQHVQTYNEQGYAAEIDSYIDSDEYIQNFGENIVPYPRTIRTQTGIKNSVFNRTFALVRGSSTSAKGKKAQLIGAIAGNLPSKIQPLAKGGGTPEQTSKRFRIVATKGAANALSRRANTTYEVGYAQLSQKVQSIQRTGGKIVSITEVA